MHTASFTTAKNSQIVTINRTSVLFTNTFTAKLAKMKSKKMLNDADMPTIGKFTLIAQGKGVFAMYYAKNGLGVLAAIITIKGNKIVAVEGK